jgi:hypothetical protein
MYSQFCSYLLLPYPNYTYKEIHSQRINWFYVTSQNALNLTISHTNAFHNTHYLYTVKFRGQTVSSLSDATQLNQAASSGR